MTPKEKALELYDKYLDEAIECDAYFVESCAKKCSLIAVNEILNAIMFNMSDEDAYNKEESFWDEVKKEIEKL